MENQYDLKRFTDAQHIKFNIAFNEVKRGQKQSHWMWFIFPQVEGLGYSETARFYAIKNLEEARLYLNHPVLGKRLVDISKALLDIEGKTANQIFGSPDDLKLKSSMTLFGSLQNADAVFDAVLKKYFKGSKDVKTLQLIKDDE